MDQLWIHERETLLKLRSPNLRPTGNGYIREHLNHDVVEVSFGWIGLLSSSKGLRQTTLPQTSPEKCLELLGKRNEPGVNSPERFEDIKNKLTLYFQGTPVTLSDEPIDVSDAPPFYQKAWVACQSIPVGETRSYQWLANFAGKPNAHRAAGQSMARNRLPIIVPCHRIISSNGSLGGFGQEASLLGLKQELLALESQSMTIYN